MMSTFITQQELTQLIDKTIRQHNVEMPYWHVEVDVQYKEQKITTEHYDNEAYMRALERDRLSDRMYPEDIRPEQFKCYVSETILVKEINEYYTLDLAKLLKENDFSTHVLERDYPDFPNYKVTKKSHKETCTLHLKIDASQCDNLLDVVQGTWIEAQSAIELLVSDMQEITKANRYPLTPEAYDKCLALLPLDEEEIEALYSASRCNGLYRQAIEERHPEIPASINQARERQSIAALLQSKDKYLSARKRGQRYTPLHNPVWNQRKAQQLTQLLTSQQLTETEAREQFTPQPGN